MKKKIPFPRKCSHPRCRRLVRKQEHSDKCTRHRLITFRDKFPLKYSFGNLRRRAIQRGIPFHLTFDDYEKFAIKTDYAKLKGKASLSLSIDRVENGLGYWPWNIAAISLRANSRKSYVPYFQEFHNQKPPEHIRHQEVAHRLELEKIVAIVSRVHEPGTKEFWHEFKRRKYALLDYANT